MNRDKVFNILEQAQYGAFKMLYVAPERLQSDLFLKRLQFLKLSFIAVDEAHCISEWGYDFRPSYLKITELREMYPNVPIMALTASATPDVVTDIKDKLAFREPSNMFQASVERHNLCYVVRMTDNKDAQLFKILNSGNFMDGVNGITAGYSLAVLIPLLIMNHKIGFIDESFLVVVILSVLVFSVFNFRERGKAKCFAGDVGSVGIAFIMLFAIGKLVLATGDVTWLLFLLVYGVDGCLTIAHRIMLHENLGEAHRKHAYQLMANELKMSHIKVSSIYMALQLIVSLGFIYVCPNTVLAHWMYLLGAVVVLVVAYVLFKKKYYHLHEEYLRSCKL
jgi:hypothetical protein